MKRTIGALALLSLTWAMPALAQQVCDQATPFNHQLPTGPVEIVPAQPNKRIYFCGFFVSARGPTLDMTVMLGQGTNCGTNTRQILFDNFPSDVAVSNRVERVGPAGDPGYALCIQSSGTGSLTGLIYWAQF